MQTSLAVKGDKTEVGSAQVQRVVDGLRCFCTNEIDKIPGYSRVNLTLVQGLHMEIGWTSMVQVEAASNRFHCYAELPGLGLETSAPRIQFCLFWAARRLLVFYLLIDLLPLRSCILNTYHRPPLQLARKSNSYESLLQSPRPYILLF